MTNSFGTRPETTSLQWLRNELPWLALVTPALVIYTVLTIIPLFQTFLYSFTNFSGLAPNSDFVGLDNYVRAFSTRAVSTSFSNTIIYAIAVPVIITLLAIPLALLLDSQMRTRNLQRAIFFFPSVISALFLGYIWNFVLSPSSQGLVNGLLLSFGQKKLLLLADPKTAMALLILVTVWTSTGWHACIYLANLQVIDQALYEAADIDGAGAIPKFRYITFPNLAPAMTISVLFLLLASLKVFDLPFSLTEGGPGYATTMVTQTIITEGVLSSRIGFASAMSIMFLALIALVTFFQVGVMSKREEKLA